MALAVGPAVSMLPKRRRWESNPLEAALQAAAVPSGSSATLSSVLARSRTWSSTFAGSRANPPHSEDVFLFSAPPRNRTSSRSFEDCRAIRHTRRASCRKCLDQDLNLALDLRRVLCDPLHHRDLERPDLESNQGQGLGEPRAIRYTIGTGKPEPTTGFAPASCGLQNRCLPQSSHVGKQECEDLNPVGRFWRPLPLPGGHSCIGPRPCDRGPWA